MRDGRFKKSGGGAREKGFPAEGTEQGNLESSRLFSRPEQRVCEGALSETAADGVRSTGRPGLECRQRSSDLSSVGRRRALGAQRCFRKKKVKDALDCLVHRRLED